MPIMKQPGWVAFGGEGMRLDGKVAKSRTISTSSINESHQYFNNLLQNFDDKPSTSTIPESAPDGNNGSIVGDIIVDENYLAGHLKFIRFKYKNRFTLLRELKEKKLEMNNTSKSRVPFTGSGFMIRSQK